MPFTPHDITILYVEDDAGTRELVLRALSLQPGYHILTAANGAEGLDLYHQNQIDIVLTDIMMPVMNGLAMARSIREINPNSQIIVMTAYSDTNYFIEAIDIGINQFVLKPVEFSKLFNAIDRCRNTVLLQQQLRSQENELLRARKLEALAVMAGGMAHDFNNLLQIILGYLSIAKINTVPGSKAFEMLTQAEKSSSQAHVLSQSLLSLATNDQAATSPASLLPLIRECCDVVRAHHADVTVECALADTLYQVKMAPDLMKQVFANLLNNSVEALPHGGLIKVSAENISIDATTMSSLPEGLYAHVFISDNGCGIPPDILPTIFDPYVSTKQIFCQKGKGLGLTICYSIIKRHNGQIMIDSEQGKGTTVHIYLPASTDI